MRIGDKLIDRQGQAWHVLNAPVPAADLDGLLRNVATGGQQYLSNLEGPFVSAIHVWPRVAFAHVRAHRCGVWVYAERQWTVERLCERPPLYGVELDWPDRRVYLAVCDEHGADARTEWPDVTAVWSLTGEDVPCPA